MACIIWPALYSQYFPTNLVEKCFSILIQFHRSLFLIVSIGSSDGFAPGGEWSLPKSYVDINSLHVGCVNSLKPCDAYDICSWWRHQVETFSALLAICAGNSPVHGEFPAQRPVTRSFDVFFDLRPNKRLSKHSRGWWFETLLCPLWHHCNVSRHFCGLFASKPLLEPMQVCF